MEPEDEADALRRSLAEGDREALATYFQRHRRRLRRMVALRLDPRVQGRVDPSDVLQEAYIEAAERTEDLLRQSDLPPFLWLRLLTSQKLLQVHRRHLGARQRDAGRDISLDQPLGPEATSAVLAARLIGTGTSPSQQAMRAELKQKVQEALDAMDPLDREVVALRHFEQLTGAETARVVGMGISAASKRYVRALKKLGAILGPGLAEAAP